LFYITSAFPGRYCILYVIGHIVVFFNSISVCVGLCIYVPVLLLVFVQHLCCNSPNKRYILYIAYLLILVILFYSAWDPHA